MEWLDDVKAWRGGDDDAKERLREYLTPYVHGALLARLPHHSANMLMPEVLERAFDSKDTAVQTFVVDAVHVARQLARVAAKVQQQERPSGDSSITEGRQWLERVRRLPENVREQVLWRFVGGIPGPELVETLALDPNALRASLERGIAETVTPATHVAGLDYVWDLSGEPSTVLARVETFAMTLRFDPLATPEADDGVNTGATFEDLSDVKVAARPKPQENPFTDAKTYVPPPEPRSGPRAPITFGADEKTEGGFDLPAAARASAPIPAPRPSMRSPVVVPGPGKVEERRTDRRSGEGRRETREALPEVRPRPETSGKKKNPELEVKRRADTEPDAISSKRSPVSEDSESSLEPIILSEMAPVPSTTSEVSVSNPGTESVSMTTLQAMPRPWLAAAIVAGLIVLALSVRFAFF